jgi:hypothetical protein
MNRLRCPREEASGDIDVIAERDGVVYLCECSGAVASEMLT